MDELKDKNYLFTSKYFLDSESLEDVFRAVIEPYISKINRETNDLSLAITNVFFANHDYFKNSSVISDHILLLNTNLIFNEKNAQSFLDLIQDKIKNSSADINQQCAKWITSKITDGIDDAIEQEFSLSDDALVRRLTEDMKLADSSLKKLEKDLLKPEKTLKTLSIISDLPTLEEKTRLFVEHLEEINSYKIDYHFINSKKICNDLFYNFIHAPENIELKNELKKIKNLAYLLSISLSNLLLELSDEELQDIQEGQIKNQTNKILNALYFFIVSTNSFVNASPDLKKEIFYLISKSFGNEEKEAPSNYIIYMLHNITEMWIKNPELIEYKAVASFLKKIKQIDFTKFNTEGELFQRFKEISKNIQTIIPLISDLPQDIKLVEKILTGRHKDSIVKTSLLPFFDIVIEKKNLDTLISAASSDEDVKAKKPSSKI